MELQTAEPAEPAEPPEPAEPIFFVIKLKKNDIFIITIFIFFKILLQKI